MPRKDVLKIRRLTPRHRIFVKCYSEGMSGTQSAIKAGYPASNASQQASLMLRNDLIQAELSKYFPDLSKDDIVGEYTRMIKSDDTEQGVKRAALADMARIKGLIKPMDSSIDTKAIGGLADELKKLRDTKNFDKSDDSDSAPITKVI